ncbi:hypothetical protein ACVBEE_14285 [Acinetobacter sp. ANC 3781]
MKDLIINLLDLNPNLTGREISKKLGIDRKAINSFLHENADSFYQNESTYQWCNLKKSDEEIIIACSSGWIDAEIFENNILIHSNLFEKDLIRFVFKGTQLLLDAILRLLCITNQLSFAKKKVVLDFNNCINTYNYINRIGFFKCLSKDVIVLPRRPNEFLANKYHGNSGNLVEIFKIIPSNQANDEMAKISAVFEDNFSKEESLFLLPKLRSFIANLIDNVREHGHSDLDGFSALQIYHPNKNLDQKKIILVVADNGLGLTNTLRKALKLNKYKDIASQLSKENLDHTKKLISLVFNLGGISQTGDENRGLGLHEIHRNLQKLPKIQTMESLNLNNIQVTVSIRQDTYQINFPYKDKPLVVEDMTSLNHLTKINGTQFILTILLTK